MNWNNKRLTKLALWGLFLTAGCSNTTVLRSYPSRINPAITCLHKGNPEGALLITKGRKGALLEGQDSQLALLETGLVEFLSGNFQESREHFGRALQNMESRDDEAIVRMRDAGAQAAALSLNDNAIPYEADGYERIFAYQYQSLVHLLLGNVEAAGIEARNAQGVQQRLLERHQTKIEQARQEAVEAASLEDLRNLDLDTVLKEAEEIITHHYTLIDEVAGQVRNAFDNPLNHFLGGFIFEMQGDVDQALPSYRDALEIVPEASAFQFAVYRYADTGDRRAMEAHHGPSIRDQLRGNGMGPELLVLVSDGQIVQKQGLKLPIPLPKGVTTVSFPYYSQSANPFSHLELYLNDTPLGRLDPVVSSQRFAYKEFKDRLPATITRTLIRAILTGIVVDKVGDNSFLAGLAVSSLGWMLENPDLRGWYTLPDHMYLYRGFIPQGEHLLRLIDEGDAFAEIPVQGREGYVKLLYVARFQEHTYVHGNDLEKPWVLSLRSAPGPQDPPPPRVPSAPPKDPSPQPQKEMKP